LSHKDRGWREGSVLVLSTAGARRNGIGNQSGRRVLLLLQHATALNLHLY
jgi:hypothetical protein